MADVKITVIPNGPYRVQGNVDLVDKAGNPFPNSEKGLSLCRCGHSNNKPLCDGSPRAGRLQCRHESAGARRPRLAVRHVTGGLR